MRGRSRCCRTADDIDAILMTGYFGGYSSGEDGLTGLGPAECAAAKQIAADALRETDRRAVDLSGRARLPDPGGRRRPGVRRDRGRRDGLGRRHRPAPRAAMLRCPRPRHPFRSPTTSASRSRIRRRRNSVSSVPARCAPPMSSPRPPTRCGRRLCSRRSACCTSPMPAASWSGSSHAKRFSTRMPGSSNSSIPRRSRSRRWPT